MRKISCRGRGLLRGYLAIPGPDGLGPIRVSANLQVVESEHSFRLVFAGLEDREQTFSWLDKAVQDRMRDSRD
jgi:hypothetical protein